MDDDLRDALEALHDFREFWLDRVTQTQGGVANNPMWSRVAAVLDKHGMNYTSQSSLHRDRYKRFDPAYIPTAN